METVKGNRQSSKARQSELVASLLGEWIATYPAVSSLGSKNGRGLPMNGSCGEFREFKCRECSVTFAKYFNHFEKPEGFPIVECYHCHGKANLIEANGQRLYSQELAPASSF
jgi:hypothetical protein